MLALLLMLMSIPQAQALQQLGVTIGPDLPHVLSGEVDLKYTPKWTIGVNGGGFAYTFQKNGTQIPASVGAGSVRVLWHPFSGSFFLGLAGGYQRLAGSATKTFTMSVAGTPVGIPATAAVAINAPFLTPYFGWMFVTRWGFTWGLELGYQLSLSTASSVDISSTDPNAGALLPVLQATPEYQTHQQQVQSQVDTYGKINLPHVSIRLGWVF